MIDPSDGLPLMEIGAWAEDKHALIRRFVHASWAARSKWPQRTYVDLFCGTGKAWVRNTKQIRDGSPLVAWKESAQHGGAFTQIIISDLDAESVEACETRLKQMGAPVFAYQGEAVITIDRVLPLLQPNGLHLVVLDPFSMGPLDYSILQKLSQLRQADIILHFSVMDLQRNIENEYGKTGGLLERFAPGWRDEVQLHGRSKEGARTEYLEHWFQIVRRLGFKVASRAPLFTNSQNGPLYRLVLLYRHALAEKLWNDVAKPSGQKDLPF